jgi:hypothetical protein
MVGAASPAAPTRPLPRLLGVLPSRQLVTQDAPHPTAELVPTPPSFTTVVLAGPATSMSLTAVVSPADRRGRHCDGEGLRCFPSSRCSRARIGLAAPGPPTRFVIAEDQSARGVRERTDSELPVHAGYTPDRRPGESNGHAALASRSTTP